MTDLAFAPAHELAALVRRGALAPLEVVDAALARIDRLNPRLAAFVALRADAARAEARALGERIARGEEPGPLAGVPFGVKDLEDLAGLPTTHGSVPFRQHVARADSTQVLRLRRAGAIPLGKTNTPEFGAAGFTKNRLFGITRNPWDLGRTAGGSSGGSAAAVAGGLVPLATASDGGGSIRIPASYTGLFGLKPTFGRVPRGPFDFLDWNQLSCYGPLARNVTDAALFLDAVVGAHGEDPASLPHPGFSYLTRLDALPQGLHVAFSLTLGYARIEAEVQEVVESAVADLGRLLGQPVEPLPDRFTDTGAAWGGLTGLENAARLAPLLERHRSEWGRGFLAGLEAASRLGPADLGRFQRERGALVREVADVFRRFDLLLTPTLPTVAFAAAGPPPDRIAGAPIASPMHVVAFTYPFNMTGHPAATVRAGRSAAGLPIGLQLIADRGREDLLLQVARVWERAHPFDGWPDEPRGA